MTDKIYMQSVYPTTCQLAGLTFPIPWISKAYFPSSKEKKAVEKR